MDGENNARIIVGASEVAGDRRHLYLLFEPQALDFKGHIFNTEAHPFRMQK